ncbi:hypothetical protein IKF92_03335 [Candidatus Saccharibacteria bacterium]|nr:hypothetical protein [Candidatus Saccharibacteria bacterium]
MAVLSTPLSGYFFDGSAGAQGDYGLFWSSTRLDNSSMRYLYVDDSDVDPANDYFGDRSDGNSVRCVKKSDPVSMQYDVSDIDDTLQNSGENMDVIDSRDGQQYKVARLADGNVWMLDNLRFDPTEVDENEVADLYDLAGLTNASYSSIDCLMNGCSTNHFSVDPIAVDEWNDTLVSANIVTDLKDSVFPYGTGSGSHKYGIFYNYCAASAGSFCYAPGVSQGDAVEDICPIGWRMPSDAEFWDLCDAYDPACSGDGASSLSMDDIDSIQYNLSLPFSGYYENNDYHGLQSDFGSLWSSSGDSLNSSLGVITAGMTFEPGYSYTRSFGIPVRCIIDLDGYSNSNSNNYVIPPSQIVNRNDNTSTDISSEQSSTRSLDNSKSASSTNSSKNASELESSDNSDSTSELIEGYKAPQGVVTSEDLYHGDNPDALGVAAASAAAAGAAVVTSYLAWFAIAKLKEKGENPEENKK